MPNKPVLAEQIGLMLTLASSQICDIIDGQVIARNIEIASPDYPDHYVLTVRSYVVL